MQDKIELAKVKAFYYQKVVELGSIVEALMLIECKRYIDDKWVRSDTRHSFSQSDVLWKTETHEYRIKPETVMHKGGEYPKPCDDIDCCHKLYSPNWDFSEDKKSIVASYDVYISNKTGDRIKSLLNAGMLHKTEEAAIAHAKVIYQIED